jgi:hypothetical protein
VGASPVQKHASIIGDLVRDLNAVAFTSGGDGGSGAGSASAPPAFTTLAAATMGGVRVMVRCGDFVRCAEGCAVVSPSNNDVRHGGGLAKAIDTAAGGAYVAGLAAIRPLPTGTAQVTGAHLLSARGITHVIHTGKCKCVQPRRTRQSAACRA